MRSELDEDFIKLFAKLPERVQKSARKNYQLLVRVGNAIALLGAEIGDMLKFI